MHITFAPRDIIQIDGARICFRNFSGKEDKYNREGDRNFALVIDDQEIADAMVKEGWNVKIRPPREDGDDYFMYMPVKVKFNDRGPIAYLKSGDAPNAPVVKLDEESIGCLDNIDIQSVDLDIRPYDWVLYEGTKNERRGRTAYLQVINVVQRITDRFAARYSGNDVDGEKLPF